MLWLLLQELYNDFDDSPGDKDDRSMDRRVFRRLFGQMCRNCASSRSAATAIVALYLGFLLAPAEGFSLRQRIFLALRGIVIVFVIASLVLSPLVLRCQSLGKP